MDRPTNGVVTKGSSARRHSAAERDVARSGMPSRTGSKSPRGANQAARICGAMVGRLLGLADGGTLWVDHPANVAGSPLAARTTISLGPDQVGHEVVLVFEQGDPRKPIVTGVLQALATSLPDGVSAPEGQVLPLVLDFDGKRLVLAAENEMVLRCGEASITLTRSGKVLVRGNYLLSRSSGVNRIKGGAVQIN